MWISRARYLRLEQEYYNLEKRLSDIETVYVPRYLESGAQIDGLSISIHEVVRKLVDVVKLRKVYRSDDNYESGPFE